MENCPFKAGFRAAPRSRTCSDGFRQPARFPNVDDEDSAMKPDMRDEAFAPYSADAGTSTRLTRRSLLGVPFGLLALSAQAAPAEMVKDVASYRNALSSLAGAYRFALVDIRADWCAVCHRIEREVLSHPSVRRHLERVPLVKVDVTAMDDDNRQLLTYLRASGPPTFFVVDATTGGEHELTRSLGSFTRRNLIRRLQPFSRV